MSEKPGRNRPATLLIMHERYRDALLGLWGRHAAMRPRLVLGVSLILALLAGAWAWRGLELHTDRSDLVSPDLWWNKNYAQYREDFPRWDDVIICFDGPPHDERVDALARAIADVVRADPRVVAADAGFSALDVGPRLFAAAPGPIFEKLLEDLASAKRIAFADSAAGALIASLADMGQTTAVSDDATRSIDELDQWITPYCDALAGGAPDFSFLRPDQPRWFANATPSGSGRLRFIQVQFREQTGGLQQSAEDIQWLRAQLDERARAANISDLEWGVTGIPAIEADETAQSIRDSTLASILAFILITGLMLAVFRGVIVPLLAAACLLIGMAWSFGWVMLSVGHLQLLSVVFSVILLGLGVDFALHLVARLELVQDEHPDLPSAISRVFRGIGPGMITGAVTTAAAFGATALTDFKGMAEMGIIAGGGILLCLVAMLSCFPAALAATGRWKRIIRHRPGGEGRHFARGRFDTVDTHPRGTLIVSAVLIALIALPAFTVRYDPNVLNLHPPHVESVDWERRIIAEDERSVWAGLIQTTPVAAPALVDRLRALPEVADVGAMGMLLPADRDERAQRIADLCNLTFPTLELDDDEATLTEHLGLVAAGVRFQAANARAQEVARLNDIASRITTALDSFNASAPSERTTRLDRLSASFLTAQSVLADWLDEALADEPLSAEDLPAPLRAQWVSGDQWLLTIQPAADPAGRSILHPDRLGAFVRAVRTVSPDVLGPPVQIFESSELIVHEYIKAACFAITAIFILLLLDFRSLADAVSAMLPVSIGFVGVFGLMGLFGAPLNLANIIVLPLIFGIGVDAGVHIVHRWRLEPYGRPAGLSGGTGRGVTQTMLTTMIGFACMLIAEHRGIRSLGVVMIAGLLGDAARVLPRAARDSQIAHRALVAAGRVSQGRVRRAD
jgi:hopanoid biosynthesis associated RND transporter like protein HpnN